MSETNLSRRKFLKLSGAVAGGGALNFLFGDPLIKIINAATESTQEFYSITELVVKHKVQEHPLSCEAGAATTALSIFSGVLDENNLVTNNPSQIEELVLAAVGLDANPHRGFRGEVDGTIDLINGKIQNYGVYAERMVKVLNGLTVVVNEQRGGSVVGAVGNFVYADIHYHDVFGIFSEEYRPEAYESDFEWIAEQIKDTKPVLVWIDHWTDPVVQYESIEGATVKLVHGEHCACIVGSKRDVSGELWFWLSDPLERAPHWIEAKKLITDLHWHYFGGMAVSVGKKLERMSWEQ